MLSRMPVPQGLIAPLLKYYRPLVQPGLGQFIHIWGSGLSTLTPQFGTGTFAEGQPLAATVGGSLLDLVTHWYLRIFGGTDAWGVEHAAIDDLDQVLLYLDAAGYKPHTLPESISPVMDPIAWDEIVTNAPSVTLNHNSAFQLCWPHAGNEGRFRTASCYADGWSLDGMLSIGTIIFDEPGVSTYDSSVAMYTDTGDTQPSCAPMSLGRNIALATDYGASYGYFDAYTGAGWSNRVGENWAGRNYADSFEPDPTYYNPSNFHRRIAFSNQLFESVSDSAAAQKNYVAFATGRGGEGDVIFKTGPVYMTNLKTRAVMDAMAVKVMTP